MKALHSDVDADGLREFSVVFTDRSVNHMSQKFQAAMRQISEKLRGVYKADHIALVPGGGTFAMEAVARQLAGGQDVLTIRNGWFSFRWSQILDAGGFHKSHSVLKARQTSPAAKAPFAPVPIDEAVAAIAEQRPGVVFAPHVETSSGIILPDDYIAALAIATHDVGGILVLDCIASGCIWVDMAALGVDVLISAPQKGWSSTPCAGIVMLNDRAESLVQSRASSSFAGDLRTWLKIMKAYEGGGHAYHATLPTEGLLMLRDAIIEAEAVGFDRLKAAQATLGRRVREALAQRGIASVAAQGFEAPGVVVSYTDAADVQNGKRFAANGLQIAAGVPLQCDEPAGFSTFRLGLFGLDKLADVEGTVATLQTALDAAGLNG
ncbi:aminotransferase class V-fold PLP-dependent enzyme [Abyssibius alkaniclasticus]|uniref:aminotransferase class V-fold PLP-dependent enzyme n=1 Tax=Abyssibius alkaniclasticus TaxID=2881234 RepID=UPI0023641DCB|nr:aminotransferase class V-fold PLP-dependent enzyme [Abyssibius alkaniclasticus]UPH72532.1 aminotransferase class V-fold PLP-dependent enzyme [Abyssibius alkaniclasticus]